MVEQVEGFQSKIQIVFLMNGEYARNLGVILKVDWIREGVSTDISLGSRYCVQYEGGLIQIGAVSIDGPPGVRLDLRVVVYFGARHKAGAVTTVGGERFILSLGDGKGRATHKADQRSKLPVVHEIAANALEWEGTLQNKGGVEVVANIRPTAPVVASWIIGVRELAAANVALRIGVVQALGPGVIGLETEC